MADSDVDELLEAANAGDALAQARYAFHLVKYSRGKDDLLQATHYYRLAAQQNLPIAQHNLATMYLKGQGLERDQDAAIEWFERAAAQNDVDSQFNLALIYDQDFSEGAEDKVRKCGEKWICPRSVRSGCDLPSRQKSTGRHGTGRLLVLTIGGTGRAESARCAADTGGRDLERLGTLQGLVHVKFETLKKQLFSILSLALLSQTLPVSADNCADGIRLYNQRNYSAANEAFKHCALRDPNTAYYAALTAQQLREIERAKHLYAEIVKLSPNTPAAKMSAAALRSLEGPAETANLPRETWVPFSRMGSHIQIDAQLNRHPVKMIFDTGADISLFSEGMLREIGVAIPDRAPDGYAGGIGKAGMQGIWRVPVDLKLGSIERRNFRVSMTKAPQVVALLGRDFYQGFEYSINDSNNTIGFKRIGGGGSSGTTASSSTPKSAPVGPDGSTTVSSTGTYVYNVPYTGDGNQIIVEAKTNGTPCKMIFDTGAGSCYFTSAQAESAGIHVPADARMIPIQGVGGGSTAALCKISSFKLGTIELHDVECAVGGRSVAKYPLLGQSFFREFHYTIDSVNKVIHFSRSK